MRAAKPILTEPEDLAVRQLGAVYRHVRLDPGLPRAATEVELDGFVGPVAMFAPEHDVFFPAREVLDRAADIFPNLSHAERLYGCRHVPSEAGFRHANQRILAFLANPD